MKALNSCIALSQDSNSKLTPTWYYEVCTLEDENYLLLHLVTGAVDVVSKEEKILLDKFFDAGDQSLPTEELCSILQNRGYLSNPNEEQKLIEQLASRHKQQVAEKPIEFFVCPTFVCPVGCKYCFEATSTRRSSTHVINQAQINSIFCSIQQVLKEQKRSLKEIVLFGGEPLLPITKLAVREILEQSAQFGYPVSVCTSGVFAKKFVELFKEFREIISVIRVTVDGPKDYHDAIRSLPNAFNRAVDGIMALLSVDIPVMVRINLGRENIEALPELAQFFVDQGWMQNKSFEVIVTGIKDRSCFGDYKQLFREDELAIRFLELRDKFEAVRYLRPVNIFMSLRHLATNLGHLSEIVKIKEEIVPLQTIKFHGCGALDGTLYVFGADNCIYMCTEAIGKTGLAVGQYYPDFQLSQTRISKWQGWHKYQIPKCRQCKYLLICGGTCTMASVLQFGNGEEPMCPPITEIINGYVSALAEYILVI